MLALTVATAVTPPLMMGVNVRAVNIALDPFAVVAFPNKSL